MMDRQKKKELAEMDSRWDFEKKVKVPDVKYNTTGIDWEKVRKVFNDLQQNHGDLYMEVSKMPRPSRFKRYKMRIKGVTETYEVTERVTFHHRQIYEWFESLANYLDISVGEAIHKVLYDLEELREELDLGDTVNVEMNSITDLEKESKVSKDELEEMIEDD